MYFDLNRFMLPFHLLACAMLIVNATAVYAWANPAIPAPPQTSPVLLENATIHPVSGPAFAGGKLLIVQGKIAAVGTDVEVPADAVRVDCTGHHVYPALFDAHTSLGLVEIDAVRATRDVSETGLINSNLRAQVAVNPDSEAIPVTRSNGVLLALTAPRGGLISGKSAVLQLDGWTYEDMTLKADVGLHVQWPAVRPVIHASTAPEENPLNVLESLLRDARAYQQAKNAGRQDLDVRWEALLPVLSGELPLIVHADDVQRIQSAVAFAEREKVRIIIYGGYDAPRCASLLVEHKVPVIIGGVYRLPQRRGDGYDAAYTVAERLRQSGVQFCISGGQDDGSNVRNLPYHAATAAAYGLPQDVALKAITLYPAEILGVADRVGSLDVGKEATLIVTNGDPLETPTQLHSAYIQGRLLDLNDKHKMLNEKYSRKYGE